MKKSKNSLFVKNELKPNLLIIVSNISLFLIFIIIIDFLCFCINFPKLSLKSQNRGFFSVYRQSYEYYDLSRYRKYLHREPIIKNNKKRPIILFGCSFTYGNFLKDNETFGYLLSEYYDRTVYNFGVPSASPREMLYMLSNSEKYLPKIDAEYVFFVYILDHVKRLLFDTWPLENYSRPGYKVRDKNIIFYTQPKFSIKRLIAYRTISQMIAEKRIANGDISAYNLLNLFFIQSYKKIKQQYPNSRFVILVYDENGLENWNQLIDNDINIIKLWDIVDVDYYTQDYQIKDDSHPNKKFWELVVPALSKKLKL